MATELVGLSLSFCVSAILRGDISEEHVLKIVSSTSCSNEQEWQGVIDNYRKTYWAKNPEFAKEIAWRLIKSGKIIQPRLGERPFNSPAQGGA